MQEVNKIWLKYENDLILEDLTSLDEINSFALTFGRDVARTFQLLTLTKNPRRNPKGYGLSDAPIVGLLTRVAKLFNLVCQFYELGQGEFFAVYSRPLIESAIVATYLLREGDSAIEDFRRCSYKDTLRILREEENGSDFYQTQSGQRVLRSAHEALALENLSKDNFAQQKRQKWRIQGKSLYEIFCEVTSSDEYPHVYGLASESIHGSWNESLDWSLWRNDDGTFSAHAIYTKVDARLILPLVRYATPPYGLWMERIQLLSESLENTLEVIHEISSTLFFKFDELYDGPNTKDSSVLS